MTTGGHHLIRRNILISPSVEVSVGAKYPDVPGEAARGRNPALLPTDAAAFDQTLCADGTRTRCGGVMGFWITNGLTVVSISNVEVETDPTRSALSVSSWLNLMQSVACTVLLF